MKIIGLYTAWVSEDWVILSIKQALEMVDELIICIGAFNNTFKKIEDKTFEKVEKYLNFKKVKIISATCKPYNTVDQNKCATLNRMIKASENINVGNWLWILDADEFYNKEAREEISKFLNNETQLDVVHMYSRFFCINFNYYIETIHERMFKIKTKNFYFTPTQVPHPQPLNKAILLKKNPMFHYSLLTGEQLRGIYWLSMNQFERLLWYYKIYKRYNPFEEEFWMKKNQNLTGVYKFWFQEEKVFEKNGHGLFHYNGRHPDLIENNPLRDVTDFRVYMIKKPNYKIYLEIMKQLIGRKKKLLLKNSLKKELLKIKRFLALNISLLKIVKERFFWIYIHLKNLFNNFFGVN